MAGMASDDAPETSRPPAPHRETESYDEESSPRDEFFSGGATNDAEQITRVVVPPPPPPSPRYPRAMNSTDAYLMFLQKQERELSVHLKGQAARDYARGLSDGGSASAASEENQVSSPWRFVALNEVVVPQRPAADQPRSQICKSCRRWRAATPRVPFKHVCLCVTCRHSPYATTCCSVCGAGRRRSSAAE